MPRKDMEEERQRRMENQRRVIAMAKEMAAARNEPQRSISVKVTKQEYEMFEKYCEMRGQTKNFVLRSIIRSLSQTI